MWTEPIYVVRTDDDSDAICCKDKEEANTGNRLAISTKSIAMLG